MYPFTLDRYRHPHKTKAKEFVLNNLVNLEKKLYNNNNSTAKLHRVAV